MERRLSAIRLNLSELTKCLQRRLPSPSSSQPSSSSSSHFPPRSSPPSIASSSPMDAAALSLFYDIHRRRNCAADLFPISTWCFLTKGVLSLTPTSIWGSFVSFPEILLSYSMSDKTKILKQLVLLSLYVEGNVWRVLQMKEIQYRPAPRLDRKIERS